MKCEIHARRIFAAPLGFTLEALALKQCSDKSNLTALMRYRLDATVGLSGTPNLIDIAKHRPLTRRVCHEPLKHTFHQGRARCIAQRHHRRYFAALWDTLVGDPL